MKSANVTCDKCNFGQANVKRGHVMGQTRKNAETVTVSFGPVDGPVHGDVSKISRLNGDKADNRIGG